jgi:uncharacterized membrane protein (UPF0127 family)
MFRAPLAPGQAFILVEARDGRLSTSIHMLCVSFSIAAVWIDRDGQVVDKALARPWRPYYASRAPARYILETSPEFLERVVIGDGVVFEDCPAMPAAARAGRPVADRP